MITKIIYLAAGGEFVVLAILLVLARKFKQMAVEEKALDFKKWMFSLFEALNNVFITIVTIFPLLGMLGTVMALLELDMAGDMERLKNNFFQALDTTEMGIVCAIIFKSVYAFFQHYIEEQIGRAKEMREKIR